MFINAIFEVPNKHFVFNNVKCFRVHFYFKFFLQIQLNLNLRPPAYNVHNVVVPFLCYNKDHLNKGANTSLHRYIWKIRFRFNELALKKANYMTIKLTSGVQPNSFCCHTRHNCDDKVFTVVFFVEIWEKLSIFIIRNTFLNYCLSPHLRLLLPHVAKSGTAEVDDRFHEKHLLNHRQKLW
jgi:hypothetical protein